MFQFVLSKKNPMSATTGLALKENWNLVILRCYMQLVCIHFLSCVCVVHCQSLFSCLLDLAVRLFTVI